MEKKSEIMGIQKAPQNAPRKKEIKKDRPRVDVGLTLEQRLVDLGEPAIGLDHITEFTNPRNSKDHPMYTCCLEGCKSAWGTSDDIYNHVKGHKHQKNFLRKMYPQDGRILGMTKDALLIAAMEHEEKDGGPDERDYGLIRKVVNYEEYMELRDRPDDWSEKKAKLGIVGSRCNSNMEPLGKRQRKEETPEPSQFDEESWAGWEPPSKRKIMEDIESGFTNGIKDVGDMIEDFNGKKDDARYEEIKFYQDTYKMLLSLHKKDEDLSAKAHQWENELSLLNNNLVEKVEAEDRAMKEVAKMVAELEEEIKQYYSHRDTNKHKNIKVRLRELLKKVGAVNPTSSHNKKAKEGFNERLSNLYKEFEDRSDNNAVEIIERALDPSAAVERPDSERTNSQRNLALRKDATENYKHDLIAAVFKFLQPYQSKFTDIDEVGAFSEFVVNNKFLSAEVNQFTKRQQKHPELSWADFKLTAETKKCVNKYLVQKMEKYVKGEVYRRAK